MKTWGCIASILCIGFGGLACHQGGQGELLTGSMSFHGLDRTYLLYLPPNPHPGMPLVLNLHGYGSDAVQQMNYTNMNAIADTAGFIVVYPNAVANRWNSGISDSPRWPVPDVDDVGFIDALIDSMYGQLHIDLGRVFACGMSNGGFMSYRLACELGHRIRAAASVTGVISENTAMNCRSERVVPMIHIHGTDDRTVPYDGTVGWYSAKESVNFWSSRYDCVPSDLKKLPDKDKADGSTVAKISYSDSLGRDLAILFVVSGGGHTWPGSAYDLPGAGATNRDINASEVILRFFSR